MEPPRLDRRPEARAFSVETLVQLVREGKIRVPEFQRPLRWGANHVLDLFDSVYRGFPIGSLLFYKREAPADLLHVGPVRIDAPSAQDAYFVVDGQQRLTALAGAMLHPEREPRGDIHAVWFDLEAERFERPLRPKTRPSWIPLNVAGDSIALLSWLNEWPYRAQRPDLVARAISLSKALREYQVPAYIVEGAADDVLRVIFKRVNTSGVEMTESDVFGALFRSGGRHPIESACARLDAETGFGQLQTDFFLSYFKLVEGFKGGRELTEAELLGLDPRAVDRTELSLLRAIRFLMADVGIPHLALLPYSTPPMTLGRFFYLHPDPAARTRELLSRWVWRGAASGSPLVFLKQNTQSSAALIDNDEFKSAERLLATIPSFTSTPSWLGLIRLSWYEAMGSPGLAVLPLMALGARDPETGVALGHDDLRALLHDRPLEGIFVDVGVNIASSVSRRVLVSSPEKLKKLPAASPQILESHGIDQEAALALANGDLATFAARREVILDAWFKRFLVGKLGLDDGDRPPVDEIVRRVEKALAAE